MILDHFAPSVLTLDRERVYKQGEPFKPNGFWVSVRGEDDWESWCLAEEYGFGGVRHEVTLAADDNILYLTEPGHARSQHKPECPSVLMLKGEAFPCDLAVPHDGWAHSSTKAEAIWGEGHEKR